MTVVPDLTTLAGQRAHYAAVLARLWPVMPPVRLPRQWSTPRLVEIWSTPRVVEVFDTNEKTIAAIIRDLEHRRRVSLVVLLTAQWYGMSSDILLSRDRRHKIAEPRQIGMAIARAVTDQSLHEIGRVFGGRDHTCVVHACKKYGAMVERVMALK